MGFVRLFFGFVTKVPEPVVGTGDMVEPTRGVVGGGIEMLGETIDSEIFSCLGWFALLADFCLGGRVIRAEIRANSGDGSRFIVTSGTGEHSFPSSWLLTTALITLQTIGKI